MILPDTPDSASRYERLIGTDSWHSEPIPLFGREFPRWHQPRLSPGDLQDSIRLLKPDAFVFSFDFHGTLAEKTDFELTPLNANHLLYLQNELRIFTGKPVHFVLNTATHYEKFDLSTIPLPMIYSTGFGLIDDGKVMYIEPEKNIVMKEVTKRLNFLGPRFMKDYYSYIPIDHLPADVKRTPGAIASYFDQFIVAEEAQAIYMYWADKGRNIKIHPDTTKESGVNYFARSRLLDPGSTWCLHFGDKHSDIPRSNPGFLMYTPLTFRTASELVQKDAVHVLPNYGTEEIMLFIADLFR